MRAEYAHDGYLVDLDLRPTTEDPRSHYGMPVLMVAGHRSCGRADNVSPLVADILDGHTVHLLKARVITDGDCVRARQMLGLPPDDPHIVPSYDGVRAAGGSIYGGGYSYIKTDRWGPSRASGQAAWMLHPSEGVILYLGGMDYAHNMAELRAMTGEDVSVGCYLETPDTARQTIVAAGWPIREATQEAARAAQAETDRRIHDQLTADRVAREGQQLLDPAIPSGVGSTIEDGHLWAQVKGWSVVPIRIKSAGFGATSDMTSNPIEDILRKQGAEIHYIAPATGPGYVGTWAGPVEEICYTLAGARWYLYLATSTTIDDWCQEWWVSQTRLTADAAADAIVECRKRAYRST